MNTLRICKLCLAPLPADAPEGICPTCLLKAGLGTQSGMPNPAAGKTPPTPEDLAKYFPNLEILELIGQGGMGVVYKARQLQLDRLVALKILAVEAGSDPSFAERFAREARALAKLNHPNIVAVYDFGRSGDYFFFVMEFVDGVNLRQMEQAQRLTPPQALKIVPLVCDALQYAHDEGVVHRDIKPGNILVDKKGRVKIADFGLAKLLGKANTDFTLTQSNLVMGTPHYMAPEQMDKPLEVDHRADIYSLGVVFYEMLTGDLPIGRFSPPSSKVQLDVRLDEVVLKALENEPQRRYQQAADVKTDVESIIGQVEKLPPTMRQAFGFVYRSKAELFGLPLLSIATGMDPSTGKTRMARGIIAIGDKARGVIALGGFAQGIVAFGGMAWGVFAIGGMAMGLFSFGGLAVALLFASGGMAIAPYVFGGIVAGYVALGGVAIGVHSAGGGANDPVARQFYEQWPLWEVWTWAFAFSLASIPVQLIMQAWGREQISPGRRRKGIWPWGVLIPLPIIIATLAAIIVPELFEAEQNAAASRRRAKVQAAVAGKETQSAAADILQKMASRYQLLMAVKTTGRVVTETDTGRKMSELAFAMRLARPDFYRIEWSQIIGGFYTNAGAAWSAGRGHYLQMGDQVSELLNRDQALAMATGLSGGVAQRAPGLFFKDSLVAWLGSLKNPSQLPDEVIGNEDCHVIAAEGEVLWITKKGYFLKQIRSTPLKRDTEKAAAAEEAQLTDDSVKTILKATGRETTPEAIREFRTSYTNRSNTLKTSPNITITQTFDSFITGELMSRGDFEHALPPGVLVR